MITWEQGRAGTREPGRSLGRAGTAGRPWTHRDLARVLFADLLHLLTAIGCGRRSAVRLGGGRPRHLPRLSPVPEGRQAPPPQSPRPQGRPAGLDTERAWEVRPQARTCLPAQGQAET